MEKIVVILLLTVAAAVLLSRKKARPGNSKTKAGTTLPEPQRKLRFELEKRMEEFLEFDHFELLIQPVVDFRTDRVCGGEVLSRLNHPERGVIFPDQFLPVVDAVGMYPWFDRYIFRKSCALLSRETELGKGPEILSCNFSRKTLSEENIASDLAEIADSYGCLK